MYKERVGTANFRGGHPRPGAATPDARLEGSANRSWQLTTAHVRWLTGAALVEAVRRRLARR